MKIVSRKRDVNSRMRGSEEFIKAAVALPDGGFAPLRWLDQIDGAAIVRDDWGPLGVRASERKCSTVVDVDLPDGTIVVSIERLVPKGGRAELTAGIVRGGEILWHTGGGIASCHSVRDGAGWSTRVTFQDRASVLLPDG